MLFTIALSMCPLNRWPNAIRFILDHFNSASSRIRGSSASAYWLAAETGMRAGELAGLRWADVDLEGLMVRVVQSAWRGKLQQPKTACAVRTFALSRQIASHLQTFKTSWRLNSGDLLFATRNGRPADMNL